MKGRGFVVLFAAALILSAVVGGTTPAAADEHAEVLSSSIYFPFVPNGVEIDGIGPWYGSVTIQNLSDEEAVRVFALDSIAFGQELDNDLWNSTIQPNGSKTFTADQLDLADPGSALVLLAVYEDAWVAANEDGDTGSEQESAPPVAAVMKQSSGAELLNATTTDAHITTDGHTGIPGTDVAWGPSSQNCYLTDGVNACAGVGEYNLGAGEIFDFSGNSYLPIVQTNSGWNTTILSSNVDANITNAGLNMTFIPAEGSTFSSGNIQETFTIDPGQTIEVNVRDFLSDHGVDEDWIGSVWIESDSGIVSSALRNKPDDDMLMINTAAPSLEGWTWFDSISTTEMGDSLAEPGIDAIGNDNFEFYGPLVFQDYNGWNSGISIVNNAEVLNTVDITFYGPDGNSVHQDSLTIPPRGMDYVYLPAIGDIGQEPGFTGSVVMNSAVPFHAAIDQVKYDSGDAMSYIATASGISNLFDDPEFWPGGFGDLTRLGMPLVQKGSAITGEGDTTGIQLFNASSEYPSTVDVRYYLSGGSLAAPTQNSPIQLTIGPVSSATIYTMSPQQGLAQMPQNFIGSAVVEAVECDESFPFCGGVVGVSNNVNYAVDQDGSAAFNMVNNAGQFRFPYSQIFSYLVYPVGGN